MFRSPAAAHKRSADEISSFGTKRRRELHRDDEQLRELTKYYHYKSDLERAHRYDPVVTEYYCDSIYRASESKGEAMIKQIEQTVRSFFPKGRFVFQEELHEQMLRATLRQTLGDDYNSLVGRVCTARGWEGPKKNLFTIASRRSGKTTGMASMIAALLIHIPNIQIVVYSVALRTAIEFVRLVAQYIQMDPLGKSMLKRPDASETLELFGPSPADRRRIRSFPSGGNAKNVSSHTYYTTTGR